LAVVCGDADGHEGVHSALSRRESFQFKDLDKTFSFPAIHSGHNEFRSKTKSSLLFVAPGQHQRKKRTKFSARSFDFTIVQDANRPRSY
jgi:hypothetical protein